MRLEEMAFEQLGITQDEARSLFYEGSPLVKLITKLYYDAMEDLRDCRGEDFTTIQGTARAYWEILCIPKRFDEIKDSEEKVKILEKMQKSISR